MDGYIGEMKVFAGNFAPRNWAFCDGRILSISSNQSLFSIVGTTYGGDGRTTFGIPDLRGRSTIGPGQGPGLSSYQMGQKAGVEGVTLNETQIPSHTHTGSGTLNGSSGTGNSATPGGKSPAASSEGDNIYGDGQNATMATGVVDVSNSNTGGGQSHENRPPCLAVYWIICLEGIYPSRS